MEYRHTPVMLKEVIELLDPKPGQKFIDSTLGGGGYAGAIAKRVLPDGVVLALDLDELALANAGRKFKNEIKNKNIILAHENFKNLQKIIKENFPPPALFDGVVFDLGLSSAQLQDRLRGFSFNLDAPLGMNFGSGVRLTAEKIVNDLEEPALAKIFKDYGEERFASKIARAIARQRQIEKITTTGQLVKIISAAIPARFQRGKIHPATKVFQALRLAVNDELENLRLALPPAVSALKPGGKIAAVSYHSLEDRIVKRYFREEAKDCLCPPALPLCRCGHKARLKIITSGVLRPAEEEVLANPRARSAKLRVAERI